MNRQVNFDQYANNYFNLSKTNNSLRLRVKSNYLSETTIASVAHLLDSAVSSNEKHDSSFTKQYVPFTEYFNACNERDDDKDFNDYDTKHEPRKYCDIVAKKSRVLINKVFQTLKSCNGDYKEVAKQIVNFSEEDLKVIYETRVNRISNKAFTPEEDEQLFKLVSSNGNEFKKIAKYFKNKTPCELKRRYNKIKTLNNILPFNKICDKTQEENEVVFHDDIDSKYINIDTSSRRDINPPEARDIKSLTMHFYDRIGREGNKIFNMNPNINSSSSTINLKACFTQKEEPTEVID